MKPNSTTPAMSVLRFVCGCILILAGVGDALAGLPDVIDRIKPAIVSIGTFSNTANPQFTFRGTGFAVGTGRMIATNAHVVPELLDQQSGTTFLAIQFRKPGGSLHVRPATLIAKAPEHDLALLSIAGDALPVVELGDSDMVREGQSVAFTGFPIAGALGYSPVTHRGFVSAITPMALPSPNSKHLDEKLIRHLKSGAVNIFQLDATAYPGNSGSPMFDPETGMVTGIINMVEIKRTREAALSQPSGISYALPSRLLLDLIRMTQKPPAP